MIKQVLSNNDKKLIQKPYTFRSMNMKPTTLVTARLRVNTALII